MRALAQHQLAALEREARQRLLGRNARLHLDRGDIAILRILTIARRPGLRGIAVLLLPLAHAGARCRVHCGTYRTRLGLRAEAGVVPVGLLVELAVELGRKIGCAVGAAARADRAALRAHLIEQRIQFVIIAAGQQIFAGRQDMDLERLEKKDRLGVLLQRIVLEAAAEGHLRRLFVHPDHARGVLGHVHRVRQLWMRRQIGHQHHGHVGLQRFINHVQQLRITRIIHGPVIAQERMGCAARQG
ncbi:hypothetical protein D3C87_1300950 [compost metagenome]